MGRLVQLPDLLTPTSEGDPLLVEFGLNWAEFGRMWRMILAMAVRDGASSVHYHPWRPPDGHMCYLISGVRHQLVPPPPAHAYRVAAAAGALMCGSWLGAVSRRWLGWPLRTSGRVSLTGGLGTSEWAGVVWVVGSLVGVVGPLAGVEWYRLDPAPVPKTA
jgi:hypothetical protein